MIFVIKEPNQIEEITFTTSGDVVAKRSEGEDFTIPDLTWRKTFRSYKNPTDYRDQTRIHELLPRIYYDEIKLKDELNKNDLMELKMKKGDVEYHFMAEGMDDIEYMLELAWKMTKDGKISFKEFAEENMPEEDES